MFEQRVGSFSDQCAKSASFWRELDRKLTSMSPCLRLSGQHRQTMQFRQTKPNHIGINHNYHKSYGFKYFKHKAKIIFLCERKIPSSRIDLVDGYFYILIGPYVGDVNFAVVSLGLGEVIACDEYLVTRHLTDVTEPITLNPINLRGQSYIEGTVRSSKEGWATAGTYVI